MLFTLENTGVFMTSGKLAPPLLISFFLPIAFCGIGHAQNNRPTPSAERPAIIQQDGTGTTYNFDDQEVTGQLERPNGTNVRVMRVTTRDMDRCLQPVFYRMRRLREQLQRYPSRIYSSRNDLRNMYIGLNHCLLPCMSNNNLEYMVDHDPEFLAAIEGRNLVTALDTPNMTLEQSLENVGRAQASNASANAPAGGLRLPEALLTNLIQRSTPQERAQFLWQPDSAGHCSSPSTPVVRPEPPTSIAHAPSPARATPQSRSTSNIMIMGIYVNSGGHALTDRSTGYTSPENNRSVIGVGGVAHTLNPDSTRSPFAEHLVNMDINAEPYGTQRNRPEGASVRIVTNMRALFNYGLQPGNTQRGFYLVPSTSGRVTIDGSSSTAGIRPNSVTAGAEAGYRLMGEDYFLMMGAYGDVGMGYAFHLPELGMETYTETGVRARFYARSHDNRTRGIVSATIARGNLGDGHGLNHFQVDALIDARIGCGPDAHGLCAILLKPYFGYTTPLRDSATGYEELEIGLGVGGSWR